MTAALGAWSANPIPLVTTSWAEMARIRKPSNGIPPALVPVPIRTSLGAPKSEWAQATPFVRELAPYGLLRKPRLDEDTFTDLYLQRLESIGVGTIAEQLEGLFSEYARTLALLCFENVAMGEFCHRRIFASWWKDETGFEVPEL